jgi:hypothetical protein
MSKIEIKQISWDKTSMNSRLEFDIKGVNHTILNTIRRVVLSSIPIYSFTPEKIVASENTSVFNNNYMKVRISNMPVYGIHSDNPIFVPIKKKEKDVKEDEKDELNDVELSYNPDSINEQFNSNSFEIVKKFNKEILNIDTLENTNEIASFGHLIDGYDAGYYGYQWSLVYAKDLFTIFKDQELNSEIGVKFKNEILSQGRIRPSIESVKKFLNRDIDINAFVKNII